ncbi:MAG: Veg family protein [Clostridia bacterium]|nr:Veg family protein [Clostridia bacterium]
MRKVEVDLKEITEKIKSLKGESVKMHVSKGRRHVEKFTGKIVDVYPSIFTFMQDEPSGKNILSYSYNEVLCGDVKIIKETKNSSN